MRANLLIGAGLFLATAANLFADVDSGPKPDSPVSKLTVFAVTGEVEDEVIDYAAKRAERPTLYVFVNSKHWDRPVARLLRTLDQELEKHTAEGTIVAVWLTEDVSQAKEYLPRAQQSIKLENTALTVFEGDASGPSEWNLSDTAHATVVVTKAGKVVQSLGLVSTNETDAKRIFEILDK